MPKIICFHSFRGGTGKTVMTTNFGVVLARLGKRVGIMDFNLKAPAMQSIMRFSPDKIRWKLNDYLWKRCNAKDIVLDISEKLGFKKGSLFFVPASFDINDIMKIIEDGYEASLVSRCIGETTSEFNLDYLLLDTPSGIDEDAILAMAVSDIIVEVTRMDEQGLTGANLSLQIVRKLGKMFYLLANMIPKGTSDRSREILEERLKAQVLGTVPFFDKVWTTKGESIFITDHPNHSFSVIVVGMVEKLLSEIEPLERKTEKETPRKEVSREKIERKYY